MVFFTCNACGESLKKAQVDKHGMKCRGCQVLSCIDCGKDFWGEDYKNHTKCISEDQKYGGKGYEAKANKGDVKQKQWLQRINEAMNKPGVSARLRDVLYQVSGYENVPRKKAKFQNWMRSSLKISNTGLQEEVWDIIAAADSAPSATQTTKEPADIRVDTNGTEDQEDQSNTEEEKKKKKKKLNKRERKEARQQKNGKATKGDEKRTAEEPEKGQTGKQKKKDRKRKHKGDEDQLENGIEEDFKKTKIDDTPEPEETEDQAASRGKFNWKGNIKAVLRESPDQELPVKRLRKKVLAAYYSFTGDINFKTEDELSALFNKKITKNPKFRVLKDRVKLLK